MMSAPFKIGTHPSPVLLSPQATIIVMGMFPPKEDERVMQFCYPNFQSSMQHAHEFVFFNDATRFWRSSEKAFNAEKIRAFLREWGIVSYPAVLKAAREYGNTSDEFLQVIEAVDLAAALAQIPDCRHIYTTGGKVTEALLDIQGSGIKMSKTGETVPFPFAGWDLTLTHLLSASRAYPLSLTKKVAVYRIFFEMAGLCEKRL